jgi:hypothetical protein
MKADGIVQAGPMAKGRPSNAQTGAKADSQPTREQLVWYNEPRYCTHRPENARCRTAMLRLAQQLPNILHPLQLLLLIAHHA